MIRLCARFVAFALIAANAAQAQDPDPASRAAADQISSGGGSSARLAHDDQLAPEPEAGSARSEAPGRFGNPVAANSRLPQLSPPGDRGTSPQLYRGGRTAQPLTALSEPAQGRVVATEALAGEDSCDPAAMRRGSSERCAQVIETRSAQFPRPDPATLSPEQRLMAEERNRLSTGAQAAARRLATNAADPDELQDQSIASQVLLTGNRAPAASDREDEAATQSNEVRSFLQTLVNSLQEPR